nr:MAG TPA: hypothetical protein [Caudoviricetes sp.]
MELLYYKIHYHYLQSFLMVCQVSTLDFYLQL